MKQQTIFIKGMVCNRCVMTVENELMEMGHTPIALALGEVSFIANQEHSDADLEKRLLGLGFDLLEDKKSKMTKEVKELVAMVYSGTYDFPERFRFSELVKEVFQKDYTAISSLFVAVEKKTIEQYIIDFRINKVKEFLVYTELTLSDIAFKLNFTSVSHLSTQFKRQTGLTPSFFKEIKKQKAVTVFSSN
jgi:AraC-like DNA-binding protein